MEGLGRKAAQCVGASISGVARCHHSSVPHMAGLCLGHRALSGQMATAQAEGLGCPWPTGWAGGCSSSRQSLSVAQPSGWMEAVSPLEGESGGPTQPLTSPDSNLQNTQPGPPPAPLSYQLFPYGGAHFGDSTATHPDLQRRPLSTIVCDPFDAFLSLPAPFPSPHPPASG